MTAEAFNVFMGSLLSWVKLRADVLGILLVGSYAKGNFRPDSDIDLVILSENRDQLLEDRTWVRSFGRVESQSEENWGAVISLRTKFEGGFEIEFGIADRKWANLDPVDKGTFQVVRDGAKVIWDPTGILDNLIDRCSNKKMDL